MPGRQTCGYHHPASLACSSASSLFSSQPSFLFLSFPEKTEDGSGGVESRWRISPVAAATAALSSHILLTNSTPNRNNIHHSLQDIFLPSRKDDYIQNDDYHLRHFHYCRNKDQIRTSQITASITRLSTIPIQNPLSKPLRRPATPYSCIHQCKGKVCDAYPKTKFIMFKLKPDTISAKLR
ncbi:hypothetical protein AVEN_248671-1 [Araneus ventricosus]|uniref:Uncharacterized protein n=1 Tax=Araneus ventricosus TaxID=182803 RepID=A0A4Y2BZU0_ARAVE|nr:hypothetical protein AVEN_248671-1 [Araneus ventricosus]